MLPELVDRVASMLNYFLSQLAGNRMQELAVANRQKYAFDPKALLERITAIYINFARSEAFAAAVATDARSYSHETMVRAAGILRNHGIASEDAVNRFEL